MENVKVYKINHVRKGSFTAVIESEDDEWATLIIVHGEAGAMLDHNRVFKGERLTVRKSLCRITEL